MRLDPKYFNLFLSVCAILTVSVILYATISYQKNQAETFRDNLSGVDFGNLRFQPVAEGDSLQVSSFQGHPVVIDFWSSWSARSRNVHLVLRELSAQYPDLTILSASVRDGEEEMTEYISSEEFPFHFVRGTSFYHDMQVPGIPSQIFLDRSGMLYDIQIGEDIERLRNRIESMMSDG